MKLSMSWRNNEEEPSDFELSNIMKLEMEDSKMLFPEKDERQDPEKKRRRSSIMKRKSINQCDNADVVQSRPSTSRRVSFASSNFVKPFLADSDENTIWDRTYEEEVKNTDSSKSYEETHEPGTELMMNKTSFQIWENNSVQYAMPNNIDQNEKENYIPILEASVNGNQTEMEITMNCTSSNEVPRTSLVEYIKLKKKSLNINDMENSTEKQRELLQMNKTVLSPADMDLSHIQDDVEAIDGGREQYNKNKTISQPVDMEFTSDFCKVKKDNNMDSTRIRHIPNETISQTTDMEFTSGFPEISRDIFKAPTIMKHEMNETVSQPIDMEFTSGFPKINKDNQISPIETKQTMNKTLFQSADMDLTEINENNSRINASPRIEYNTNETISKPVDMDFTSDLTEIVENSNSCGNKDDSGMDMLLTRNLTDVTKQSKCLDNDMNKENNTENHEKQAGVIMKACPAENSSNKRIEICEKSKGITSTKDSLLKPTDETLTISPKLSKSLQTEEQPNFLNKISEDLILSDENQYYSPKTTNSEAEELVKQTKILYTNPSTSILRDDDVSYNFVTPSMSFAMNSSFYVGTTQQFMQVSFSKPETIDVLLLDKKATIVKRLNPNTSESVERNTKTEPDEMKTIWDNVHYRNICDITPPLVDNEDFSANLDGETKPDGSFSVDSSNHYTLLSKKVVDHIEKYLTPIKFDYNYTEAEKKCEMLCKRFAKNNRMIKELEEKLEFPIFEVPDFEEMLKEDEASSSQLSEDVLNDTSEGEQRKLTMPDMVLPLTLHERVCEAALRSEKYWEFVKANGSFYCFFGCFRAVPFRVNVHPELGIVYGIETFNNLADNSTNLSHYGSEIFKVKLDHKNLLPHLGQNFDLLTLLDYVSMCTEEIGNFHLGFQELKRKYGISHKLDFHRDYSVTFEILDVDLIIWWKISVKLSTVNLGHFESVSATHELREKVDEEHIKNIAENCVNGPQFLECFIKKVDEYVQRIGRRILMRRQGKLKYGQCT